MCSKNLLARYCLDLAKPYSDIDYHRNPSSQPCKLRQMALSFQTVRKFLVVAAFCNQILAFRSNTIESHRRCRCHLQNDPIRRRRTQQYAYSGFAPDDFESMIQAATSEAKGVYGGDFAGLAATFNPGDGSFIPIPDYLIPEGLKEWGQEPKCLEVLVSEDIHDNGEESVMTRVTTKILPATGCSVDNLETMIATDEIDLDTQLRSDESNFDGIEDIVGLQYPLGADTLRVETIFGLQEEYGVDRIRVAIDLIPSEDDFAIKSPMMLTLERRTSSSSSGGSISQGGGLDGRTVYMLLGEKLRASRTFVDEPVASYDNSSFDDYDPSLEIRYVHLPAGICLAYGWIQNQKSWMLQVSQVAEGSRRVMSRQFTTATDGELDFEMRSWIEDSVWEEQNQ